jgi:cytochrome c peroxidase
MKPSNPKLMQAMYLALLLTPPCFLAVLSEDVAAQTAPAPLTPQPNETGSALTISSTGTIDRTNPFFQPFGNGRACASCHQEGSGWSVSPSSIQARFTQSQGNDPIFRTNDGSNSPNAPVGTLDQKKAAYSMLLNRGTIRVGLPMPANAEFSLVKVEDPYGFASAKELSMFRRPLPTTNLRFSTTVMWDGRETLTDTKSSICILSRGPQTCFASVDVDLAKQANDATRGHAQAPADLTAAQQSAIVRFEKSLTTAQVSDKVAGALNATGVRGGPQVLTTTPFYFGINDLVSGDYQTKAPFNRNVMTMYGAWLNLAAPPAPPPRPGQRPPPAPSASDQAKASIARGEQIFNTRPFLIDNVPGFGDVVPVAQQRNTCSSCHNAPNNGSTSVPRLFHTGVAAAIRRTPDLPLYTFKNNATGEILALTDPGQGLVSGKWRDLGKFKTPSLRGLEARSPYFHDGSATSLEALVQFYNARFRIGFNNQEKADLVAFLATL